MGLSAIAWFRHQENALVMPKAIRRGQFCCAEGNTVRCKHPLHRARTRLAVCWDWLEVIAALYKVLQDF